MSGYTVAMWEYLLGALTGYNRIITTVSALHTLKALHTIQFVSSTLFINVIVAEQGNYFQWVKNVSGY